MANHLPVLAAVSALVFLCAVAEGKMALDVYKRLRAVRECLGGKHPGLCLKERALEALNETIHSDQPWMLHDVVRIEKNPAFRFNSSEGSALPEDVSARSSRLSDVIHDKVEEFFRSRTFKFDMAPVFEEGRGKKDKGGKGGMMMLMMGGMACMAAQMFLGKVAFLAGTALIMSKIALVLSAVIGLKKLASGGGGGGETQHVVYTSGSDYGHSHGGGGWHRSLGGDALAYRSHPSEGY